MEKCNTRPTDCKTSNLFFTWLCSRDIKIVFMLWIHVHWIKNQKALFAYSWAAVTDPAVRELKLGSVLILHVRSLDSDPAVFVSLSSTVTVCSTHNADHITQCAPSYPTEHMAVSSFIMSILKQFINYSPWLSGNIHLLAFQTPPHSLTHLLHIAVRQHPLFIFIWRPAVAEHLNSASLPPPFSLHDPSFYSTL